MKPGGLIAAVCVLAVLSGLLVYTKKHPPEDPKKAAAAPKIISADVKTIESLSLGKSGEEPVVLNKSADKWEVTKPAHYPADQDAVSAIANAMADLTSDRLIEENATDLNPFGLATPALEVSITLKGGKNQKLLIGADNPAGNATYVKLDGEPKVYTIASATKTNLTKSLGDVRDKRLLTFDQEKLTAATLTAKGTTTEFTKNKLNEWSVVKPKAFRADGLQVDDLIRALKDAKMDLANDDPAATAKAFAAAEKVATATVTDSSGTQTIEIHKTKDNSYYAKSSAVEGTYKLAAAMDGLTKTADDFRNKKLFDFGFNDPSKVEISGKAYQRSGDKWTVGTAQFDAPSMQAVIDKLRDLSATKFAEKTPGAPVLTLTVTSNSLSADNGRVEKVTIAKEGDAYAAQRDGEASLYIIDAKSIDELQKAISEIKPYVAPKPDTAKK